MSTHENIEELADLATAGAWTPDEHATSCASCAATLAGAREFRSWASGAILPDAPPADLEERVIARFRATNTAAARRFRLLPFRRALKSAVAAAGVIGLVALGNRFTPPAEDVAGAPLAFAGEEVEAYSRYDKMDGASRGRVSTGIQLQEGLDEFAKDVAARKEYTGALEKDGLARGDAEGWRRHVELGIRPAEVEDLAALGDKVNVIHQAGGKVNAAPSPTPAPEQDGRKLIHTARLALEVDAYEAAHAKVSVAAAEEKGSVASADTERLQNGKIRATLTLRVPPERFESLLAKLRALGTVKNQSLGSQDVTKAYVDMEARLGAKQALYERLKKILTEGKGSMKELMEVEVQMGATLERIEALKGELKYLDNQISLSTITLELAEKDLGRPFEYVQTLQSRIGIVTAEVDAASAAAQKAVLDAGGQVVDSKMTRQNDGAATGTIRARVDAEKFPDVRRALRALGHVETDTVDQRKTARGGEPSAAAPVRVELATIDLTVATPALIITRRGQLRVETKDVEGAYLAARRTAEAAGARVLDGGLSKRVDGASASLTLQVDVDKSAALIDAFKAAGEVKQAVVNQSAQALAVPVRERAEISLALATPPAVIGEEVGIGKTIRETFGRSWAGLLWSVEKLFVGISLAGPWLLAAGLGWLGWRRARRRKAAPAQ
jgi:hypothetical protein